MTLPADFKMKDYQKRIFNEMKDILDSGKKIILQRSRCNGKRMSRHYFLNPDHSYTPCDLMTWGRQFESEDRQVAYDEINGYIVSTIWVGINQDYFGGPPLVFETMVFKDTVQNIYCQRYTTWDQALAGHQETIEWVKNGCKEDDL